MAKKKQNLSKEELLEQALLPESECPYKVPDNWVWTKIMNISNLYNGDRGTNYPSKSDFVNEGVPFINAGALSYGKLDLNSLNFITEEKFNILKAGKVRKNDILYCLRGTLGKNAFLNEDIKGAIASSLCIIRGAKKINTKYLFYLINSEVIIMQQHRMDNGTAQPNLSAASVKNYYVPLPPLSEQQRIVERIESLFEKLDKSKELIQDAIDSFENRKTAILHKAFSGELTQKWREENGVGIESWEEKFLGDYAETNYGYSESAHGEDVGPKFLRITDIQDGVVIWDTVPFCPISNNEYIKYKLSVEDIVVARTGATTGKSYMIVDDVKAVFASYLIRIKLKNLNKLSSKFIYKFLQSQKYWSQITELSSGIAQPGVNASKLKSIIIPLPIIAEQIEIVKILDDIFEKEQSAYELYDLIEKIDLMKKAILARAFRGELGTNDSLEESAISLLAEIIDDLK